MELNSHYQPARSETEPYYRAPGGLIPGQQDRKCSRHVSSRRMAGDRLTERVRKLMSLWLGVASVFVLGSTTGMALAAGSGGSPARHTSAHAKQLTRYTWRSGAIRSRPAGRAAPHDLPVLAPGSGCERIGGSQQVRIVQRRLAAVGFAPGPIDGRYRPLTTAAVERFQRADRLKVDGIFDPLTRAPIRARPTLFPGAGYDETGGSQHVRALQRRLRALGFAPGSIDGRYGPLTTAAVERFQRAHGPSADGIVGTRTLAALTPPRPGRRYARQPYAPSLPQNAFIRQRRPTGARRGPDRLPALPVTPVLFGLAALGLATMSVSYARMRASVLRAQAPDANGRSAAPPRPPAGWRAALSYGETSDDQ